MITKIVDFLLRKSRYAYLLECIRKTAVKKDAQVYIVGGAVRDLILGGWEDLLLNDLDFVVFGADYGEFAKAAAAALKAPYIPFKDNVRVPWNGGYIDISAPRGGTVADDLRLRDFTINNLALTLHGELIGDPSDIINGVVRPAYTGCFRDDPLRILRGFRLAARLGFKMSDNFYPLAAESVSYLKDVAPERVNDELKKFSRVYTVKLFGEMSDMTVWSTLFDICPDIRSIGELRKLVDDEDDKVCYAFFLGGLFLNNPEKAGGCIEKMGAGNKTETLVKELLNGRFLRGLEAEKIENIVWRKRDIIRHVVCFALAAEFISEVERNGINCIIDSMNAEKADLISGDDILSASKGIRQGRWIAVLLEDIKMHLAYGRLKNREEALEYLNGVLEKGAAYGQER